MKPDQTDRAATLLLRVVAAKGALQVQAREFLSATHDMDRATVVRAAAEKLAAMLSAPNATDDAEQAIWNDVSTLFG